MCSQSLLFGISNRKRYCSQYIRIFGLKKKKSPVELKCIKSLLHVTILTILLRFADPEFPWSSKPGYHSGATFLNQVGGEVTYCAAFVAISRSDRSRFGRLERILRYYNLADVVWSGWSWGTVATCETLITSPFTGIYITGK